jgi:transcriptional regulator with XRE-family HTH domain
MAWSSRRPNSVFSEEYEVLRRVLVECRFESGLTQRALAERIGKCPSHLSMIEKGQRRLDTLELYRIALACEIEPEVLFAKMCAGLRALAVA